MTQFVLNVGFAALWMIGVNSDPPESIDTILEKVEKKGKAVRDIQCSVEFIEEDRISEDTTKRYGTILFKRKKPNPVFIVSFEKSVQSGRINRMKSWYRFDGRYFFEALERSRSIIQRDLAPPGTQIDLFSLDKAPFPIPFGQKKADILEHFNVKLGPALAAGQVPLHHLICTPKPGSRFAGDYSKVEFFVSPELELPVRIVMTTDPPDKVTTADFPDLSDGSINTDLPDSRFELPPETRSYSVAKE